MGLPVRSAKMLCHCNSRKGLALRDNPGLRRLSPNALVLAGLIPGGLNSHSADYKTAYREARDMFETIWWQSRRKSLVGAGRPFSILEWARIQQDVLATAWRIRGQKGEKAAMKYVPSRKEYGLE